MLVIEAIRGLLRGRPCDKGFRLGRLLHVTFRKAWNSNFGSLASWLAPRSRRGNKAVGKAGSWLVATAELGPKVLQSSRAWNNEVESESLVKFAEMKQVCSKLTARARLGLYCQAVTCERKLRTLDARTQFENRHLLGRMTVVTSRDGDVFRSRSVQGSSLASLRSRCVAPVKFQTPSCMGPAPNFRRQNGRVLGEGIQIQAIDSGDRIA